MFQIKKKLCVHVDCRCSGVFFFLDFEYISPRLKVFLLLALNR